MPSVRPGAPGGGVLGATSLERVLQGADPVTMAAILVAATSHPFEARDILVRQGDTVRMIVLLEGCVAVRQASSDGRALTLQLMLPGDVLGLASVSGDASSPFDLVALAPGRISILSGRAMRGYAERDPRLAMRLFDLSIDESELLTARLDEAVFEGARKRFARVLLFNEALVTSDDPIVSRGDLAGLIGTSREMLGSVIRAFEAEGVISRHGRRIAIDDRVALEREAGRAGTGGRRSPFGGVPPGTAAS